MPRQVLTNFTKGELGPELHGRIDLPQYQAGAKRVRNFIGQKYGGLSFRPGFQLVGPADDVETPIRYFPFQFSIEQAYVLPFWEASMRVLALGGMVLEDNLEILSITLEAQAIVEVAYHQYAVGETIYFNGVDGMTELNGQFVEVVEVIDDSHFRIDVDTSGFPAFVSSTGVTRGSPPSPPPPPPPPPPPSPTPPDPPDIGTGGGNGSKLNGGGE